MKVFFWLIWELAISGLPFPPSPSEHPRTPRAPPSFGLRGSGLGGALREEKIFSQESIIDHRMIEKFQNKKAPQSPKLGGAWGARWGSGCLVGLGGNGSPEMARPLGYLTCPPNISGTGGEAIRRTVAQRISRNEVSWFESVVSIGLGWQPYGGVIYTVFSRSK